MPIVLGLHNPLPPVREMLQKHGVFAKKSLGQNFLFNLDITRRITKAAGNLKDTTVFEVGPGPGALTRALLEAGGHIVAIEKDSRCLGILNEVQAAFPGQLTLIEGDALATSPQEVIPNGVIKVVANLPYNIGTALLLQWLSNLNRISSLTVMFQKEVALRLTAKPKTKDYGRLSVLAQWLCEVQRLFDLSPQAFTPAPKVTSSVVQLIPRPLRDEERKLLPIVSMVTQHAFGQRRKMLRSSLKSLFPEARLEELGIIPHQRAEELGVSDFIRLAQAL